MLRGLRRLRELAQKRQRTLGITHIFFEGPRREEVPANHANHTNKILLIRVICVIRGPYPQSF